MTGGAVLLEGIPDNPLPASLEMRLRSENRSLEGFAILEMAMVDLPGIEELRHGREWIDGYARVASLIRVSGYAVGVVLALATLLIVANTISVGHLCTPGRAGYPGVGGRQSHFHEDAFSA